MGLKEEMADMIHLIAEPLKEEYDMYSVEMDSIRNICDLYDEDVTYGESCQCNKGTFACNKCVHCQCVKVDLSFWNGADMNYNYQFGNKEKIPSVKTISNRKQLLKEMTNLKTELECYKDFCAEFGRKYKKYLDYAKAFAEEVKERYCLLFGLVQTDVLPIIFHVDYTTDKDNKIDYQKRGDLRIADKQNVMNIYCCLSDLEETKCFIRHEVLHYMLYISGFQYADDSAIFHYFCNQYDAHAYEEMPDEQQELYDKLQNAKSVLEQVLKTKIPEDQRKTNILAMIVAIGISQENQDRYKDLISNGNKLLEMLGDARSVDA